MHDLPLLQQITTRLHSEGGRMTSQRRLIVESLQFCAGHPTAEEIFEQARQKDGSIHLSTVYRTLRWLEEEGFVSPRWFEGERRQERFDTASAQNQDHYHFRCHLCNTIIEFSEPLMEDIKNDYQSSFGGRIESADLILYGTCAQCLRAQ